MKLSISAIILTFNEEANLLNCLKSITDLASEIIIVDSYSTDKTEEIAKQYGAKFIQHKFINQAEQFNWALDNVEIKGDWILKLDADEYLLSELKTEIENTLPNTSEEITGFYMKRRVYFMNRWIKHGDYYPRWFLRLWRKRKGRSEQRQMDEHIILLEGNSEKLKNDFADDNKKGMKDWIEKHKKYALREVKDIRAGSVGETKRRNFYYKLPLFIRVFVYYIYRYFLRGGFLDGFSGLVFHFLHGFWYRWLVDWKILKLSFHS